MTRRTWFWLILILLVATTLRAVALDTVPPGLYHDEAFYGLDALGVLRGAGFPVFFEGNGGREPLFIYAQAVSLGLFGTTPWTLRITAAFVGVLTVAAFFVLARALTNDKYADQVALIASAALATSYWHLHFSRVGWRAILLPLFACLAFYWFWRAYRSGRLREYVFAGVLLGASLYTYLSARFLPIVIVLFWVTNYLASFNKRQIHLHQPNYLAPILFVVAALGVFAPLGFYFILHPNAFFFRVNDVALPINDWLASIWRVAQMFFTRGDAEWRHGIAYRPVLDWFTGLPFAIGFLNALWRWREPAKRFALIWFVLLLLPTIISQGAPDTLRAIGALPAMLLFVAWGWQVVAMRLSPQRLFTLGMLFTLVGSGWLSGRDYFIEWANHRRAYYDFQGDLVELVRWIGAREENVVVPFETYAHPTFQFLIRVRYTEQPFPFRGLNTSEPTILVLPSALPNGGYVLLRKHQAFWLHPLANFTQPSTASVLYDRFSRPIGSFWKVDSQELDTALRLSSTIEQHFASPPLFDGRMELHAAFFPREITPGKPLTLGLIWRNRAPIQSNLQMFAHILDSSGHTVGGVHTGLFFEYPLTLVPNDSYLPARYDLQVNQELLPGKYVIEIGLFHLARDARVPIEINGKRVDDDRILVQPLKVGLQRVPPPDLRPARATFGDLITLIGFDIAARIKRGEDLKLTLLWKSEKFTQYDYTLFVHVLDDAGNIIAQTDTQPLGGTYPTSIWDVGELVTDEIRVTIPPHAPSGRWRIGLGWYDAPTGRRLPVADGDMLILYEVELD
ncbi:MAG: glycosyltransferase family 39 protein [Anaerolineae bacterium]|nr:glycosyltransferase family 39 protein [Anaerolineae bacterium]